MRIFPKFFEEFLCFVSWEMETAENSPKIPASFQCEIPRQIREKEVTKVSWRAGKVASIREILPKKFLVMLIERFVGAD